MSTVNLAEVFGRVSSSSLSLDDYLAAVRAFGVVTTPVTDAQALEAAKLRSLIRPLGRSLGDWICLAPARERRLPVLTMDRQWLRSDFDVSVARPG